MRRGVASLTTYWIGHRSDIIIFSMFRTSTSNIVVIALLCLGLSACTVRIPLSTGGPVATSTPEGFTDPSITPTASFSSAGEAYRRGRALFQKGDYKAAAAAYSEAIVLDPNYVNAYLERGATFRRLGNFENALTDLNRAAQLEPTAALAYRERAYVNLERGNPTPALVDAGRAIELNASDAESYYVRGQVLTAMSQFDSAVLDYSKAIAIKTDYAEAYYGRAAAFRAQGQKNSAVADFRVVLTLRVDAGLKVKAETQLKELGAL